MILHLPVSEMIRILIDRAYEQGQQPITIRLSHADAQALASEMFELLRKEQTFPVAEGEYFAGIEIESIKALRTHLVTISKD